MDEKDIRVFLCTKDELLQAAEKCGANTYNGHLRGFCIGNDIYLIENCPGRLGLGGHEFGHVVWNEKHTVFPGIMNFSGLFRWFAFQPSDILGILKKFYKR